MADVHEDNRKLDLIMQLNKMMVEMFDRRIYSEYEFKAIKGAVDRLANGIGGKAVEPIDPAPIF